MKPRFLLDENVGLVIQRQLRRREPTMTILAVGDPGTPPLHARDPDILRWVEAHQYILVTWDRSTMPNHVADHYNAGGELPGVLLIRRGSGLGQIIEAIHLIWSLAELEEYQDTIQYIP